MASSSKVVLNRPKSTCFGLMGLECLAHEVSVLFSFRLKFPYSACLRNPSQTVVATYPPIAGINLLQGP
jgi:hypothetical protein